MKTSDFDYSLPAEFIAQTPVQPRDKSRLMVLHRGNGLMAHRRFTELVNYLQAGDVLVFNDSRVIPARLRGKRVDTGGGVELLLLRRLEANVWEALVKRSKRLHAGTEITLANDPIEESLPEVSAEIIEEKQNGIKVIRFSDETLMEKLGEIPLPPYIHVPLANPERYQTIYGRVAGSVASTTAGLHFTSELLEKIKQKGVHCLFTTLHIGLDTFNPVREEDPREHAIHSEYGVLGAEAAGQLSRAKKEGRRVVCVGTTTVRIVEQAAQLSNPLNLQPFEGWVNLFILPGYQFRVVDAMVTNFHLPRSTLLMLVTAFAGKGLINKAYQEAIVQRYRFYSFGDAMLVL